MKDPKDVTCLVIDHALHPDFATRLARDFKKVYYHCPPSGGAFQTINAATVGEGLEGIEVVPSIYFDRFNTVDLFVFTDVGFGWDQLQLEKLGKKVWGSRNGEELELERDATKKAMKGVGLPVGPYKIVRGTAALRDYLRAHSKVYVKVSRYRGTFESFFAKNLKNVEPLIDEMEHDIGPKKTEVDFVIEEGLPDCIETGTDAWTADGKWPKSVMTGVEVKDSCYVAQMKDWTAIEEPVRRWNESMALILRKYGYRGGISTEVRIGKDHVPYAIDLTCRNASPPSELFAEMFRNMPAIVWGIANGVMVEADPVAKFGAQAIIKSSWAGDRKWQPIDFDPKYRKNIKLHCGAKIQGQFYIVPQSYGLEEIGSVVGWGNSLEAAIKMVKDVAETIDGHCIKIATDAFDEAQGEIEKANSMGLKIF